MLKFLPEDYKRNIWLLTMSGKLMGRQVLRTALLFAVITSQFVHADDAENVSLNSTDSIPFEPFLEYHFHTYFDYNDSVQVAHAIDIRNEVIAMCVSKKIIAIPLHWHYDPENPVAECKLHFVG